MADGGGLLIVADGGGLLIVADGGGLLIAADGVFLVDTLGVLGGLRSFGSTLGGT